MLKKIIGSALISAIFVGIIGCGYHKLEIPKKDTLIERTSNKITVEESKQVISLIIPETINNNHCSVTRRPMRDTRTRVPFFAFYQKCIKVNRNNINIHVYHNSVNTIHFKTPNKIIEVDNIVQGYANKVKANYNLVINNYLSHKEYLKKTITKINSLKPTFKVTSSILPSKYTNTAEESIYLGQANYYINLKATMYQNKYNMDIPSWKYENLFTNYNQSNSIIVNYKTPFSIYFLYKRSGSTLSLEEYVNTILPVVVLNKDIKVSNSLKYSMHTDKVSLTLNDLKDIITYTVNDNSIYAKFLPSKYLVHDQEIEAEFIGGANKVVLTNKTKNYMNINAVSFYYGKDITTREAKLKLPPMGTVDYSLRLSNEHFIKLTSMKQKLQIGLAVEYTNLKDSKKTSLLELKKVSFQD